MNTFSFPFDGTTISVDFHAADAAAKAVILYYHGGGLFYGRRDDLPDAYIRQFTQAGYHLLCLDYLLGPECPLSQIHRSVCAGFEWFLRSRDTVLGVGTLPFVLFGRSAGAYLALTLAHRLTLRGGAVPRGLLAFYGYYNFGHPFFQNPSPHYASLPAIPAHELPDFTSAPRLSSASIDTRFYLYVYARQSGRWAAMLDPDGSSAQAWSIPEDALSQLPPTFLTASTADQDVPFSYSKKMSARIPVNEFLFFHGLEHDYDRDPLRPESQALYRRCLNWLDRQCT